MNLDVHIGVKRDQRLEIRLKQDAVKVARINLTNMGLTTNSVAQAVTKIRRLVNELLGLMIPGQVGFLRRLDLALKPYLSM